MGWGTLAPDREARLETQIRWCGFNSRRGYQVESMSSPARCQQCEQLLIGSSWVLLFLGTWEISSPRRAFPPQVVDAMPP